VRAFLWCNDFLRVLNQKWRWVRIVSKRRTPRFAVAHQNFVNSSTSWFAKVRQRHRLGRLPARSRQLHVDSADDKRLKVRGGHWFQAARRGPFLGQQFQLSKPYRPRLDCNRDPFARLLEAFRKSFLMRNRWSWTRLITAPLTSFAYSPLTPRGWTSLPHEENRVRRFGAKTDAG
jgi:hypothetical protein